MLLINSPIKLRSPVAKFAKIIQFSTYLVNFYVAFETIAKILQIHC